MNVYNALLHFYRQMLFERFMILWLWSVSHFIRVDNETCLKNYLISHLNGNISVV